MGRVHPWVPTQFFQLSWLGMHFLPFHGYWVGMSKTILGNVAKRYFLRDNQMFNHVNMLINDIGQLNNQL